MNAEFTDHAAAHDLAQQVDRLTDSHTMLESRIAIARQLFPAERKKEMLENADTDTKGRPVRYFRLVTYAELQTILSGKDINATDNSHIQTSFNRQFEQIKEYLKMFLEKEGIFHKFQTEFEVLSNNFTLENYRAFVQSTLPRRNLFRLHIAVEGGGGSFTGVTGLSSLSVGAPYQLPYDPSDHRAEHHEGLPVIEMSIPSNKVYVHPFVENLKEMEKEVNATTIKPEWITDIYNGTDDFIVRFVKDPGTVLYSGYKERVDNGEVAMDWVSERHTWDILQKWKQKESITELIPVKKVEEMNPNNPNFDKPLLAE